MQSDGVLLLTTVLQLFIYKYFTNHRYVNYIAIIGRLFAMYTF